MQNSGIPAKFQIPFASGAGGGYIRAIPRASQIGITAGAASLTDGFPPVTFAAVGAGGVPPFGQDMNGILNQISAWSQWQQAGGPIAYDSTFQAAVGGYPAGAIVASTATAGRLWRSTVDNNLSNPDGGGAGWTALRFGPTTWAFYYASQSVPITNPNVDYIVIAGGGGGGGAALGTGSANANGSGGGGGAAAVGTLQGLSVGASLTLVVGAGGAAGVGSTPAGAGGVSTITGYVTANGGAPGVIDAGAGATGGAGGSSGGSNPYYASGTYGYISAGQQGQHVWSFGSFFGGQGGANGLGQPGGFAEYSGFFPGAGGGGGGTSGGTRPAGAGAGGIILLRQ